MQKVLLLILDGWGYRREKEGNVLAQAKLATWNKLWKTYPHTLLEASGKAVGLPEGYMGNSQVGHLTLGAGRIVPSDLLRVNASLADGSFFKNKVLLQAFEHCKKKVQKLHLLGLLSDAGVHAHINHLFALLELAKKMQLRQVYIHAFLDGRDTPPKSAKKFIWQLQQKMQQLGVGELASIMGRYYAMDRDNRWGREHKAYDCMVNCAGRKRSDPLQALDEFYARGETDEFIKPTLFLDKCVVDENDAVIFFNFRSDRARELTRAFVWGKFKEFQRKKIMGLHFVTLTQYDSLVKSPVAFPPEIPKHTLGEVISLAGLSQLRIAETEKWAHVTYFFNGLCECVFPHEHRIHIPSRKVTTYDKTPGMKVQEITEVLLRQKDKHDFFVANFANADMVGHSGNLSATRQAVQAIDKALVKLVKHFPGVIFVTADHGNAENKNPPWQTSHTLSKVPLLVMGLEKTTKNGKQLHSKLGSGGLADVAPSIIDLLQLRKPKEMTGKSLFVS